MNGNASFAGEDVSFTHGNGSFAGGNVLFADGNAAARTFGRAHRRRPYAFRLRELRIDVRPYGFVWLDCGRTVDVVWVDYA